MNIVDWQLAKNLKMSEFECNCGCGDVKLDYRLINGLQSMRDIIGMITITSAYRCSEYNAKLKGASPKSQHLLGKAADIKTKKHPYEVAKLAYIKGFRGIGVAANKNYNYVHVDVRDVYSLWYYDESNKATPLTEEQFKKLVRL